MGEIDYNRAIQLWSNVNLIAAVFSAVAISLSAYAAHMVKINTEMKAEYKDRVNDVRREDEFKKLSSPLPTEFEILTLRLKISPDRFEEFLPDFRKQIEKLKPGQKITLNGDPIEASIDIKNEPKYRGFLSNFKKGVITWSLNLYPKDSDPSGRNSNPFLNWWFRDNLDIENNKYKMQFVVDYRDEKTEFFRLKIDENTKTGKNEDYQNYLKYLSSEVTSAVDLCSTKGNIAISAGRLNNQHFRIEELTIKDNYKRIYKFENVKTNELQQVRSIINLRCISIN